MRKSSKAFDFTNFSKSEKTERNRLMLWDSAVQEFNESIPANQSPRSAITPKLIEFVCKIVKLIFTTLFKLPYTLFKLGYEIAKIVTRGLSSIRRLLFVAR